MLTGLYRNGSCLKGTIVIYQVTQRIEFLPLIVLGTMKDRNGIDLTKHRRDDKSTQKNYTKKILMTQITMMVWSLT